MKNSFISVIVPTYNRADLISETIESILNQTYKNFELIIVDDGSTDNTEEMIRKFKDSRIKYIKTDNWGGPARPRNIGIKKARGEYIAFCDDDDMWDKRKLEKQIPHFQSSKIVGVASDAILIGDTPYYRKKNYGRSKLGYVDYQYIDILNGNKIMTSSCIVKRKILEKVRFFDENRDFCFIEDWELWLRMARFGLFRVLGDPLIFYLVSRKRGYQFSIISKNCLKIIKKQVDMNYVKYNDIKEVKALIYLSIALNLLEYDRSQSRKYCSKALETTLNIRKKIISYGVMLISFYPTFLIKIILQIFYKFDHFLYALKDKLYS